MPNTSQPAPSCSVRPNAEYQRGFVACVRGSLLGRQPRLSTVLGQTMVELVQIGQILPRSMSPKERLTMSDVIHNTWVRPNLHVLDDAAADRANLLRRARLKVDGLVCGL